MMTGLATEQPPVEVSSMAARLSRGERALIEARTAAGARPEEIAELIGRAPSTVYRELGRCGGAGCYSAEAAQQHADGLARRPGPASSKPTRRWSSGSRPG